ncbi:MAG: hypothetical protein PHF44_03600 [Candidatus Pacebacteria bacterium]|nr:hypothetical protein [Candidatus Paceibacterota bacterium]
MKIIGHKKNWVLLENLIKTGKFSHAYLFCGQENLGKKTVAVEFLKLAFGEDLFCHPDFIFVEPAESEIQISQIRDLNWKLSLKPFSAPFKAAIIDNAHLMNTEAQNCFLKTLEEPKGNTILILVTDFPEALLPTIKSRVQKIKFFPVEKKEIENYLRGKGLAEKEVNIISEVSMGRPGSAINLLSDPEKLGKFKKKIKEITEILDSDLAFRFRYAKELADSGNVRETLNIWLGYFRNILLSNMKLKKNWVILRKTYTFEKLKNILKNIQTTIFLTSTTNINPRLALEVLMMDL